MSFGRAAYRPASPLSLYRWASSGRGAGMHLRRGRARAAVSAAGGAGTGRPTPYAPTGWSALAHAAGLQYALGAAAAVHGVQARLRRRARRLRWRAHAEKLRKQLSVICLEQLQRARHVIIDGSCTRGCSRRAAGGRVRRRGRSRVAAAWSAGCWQHNAARPTRAGAQLRSAGWERGGRVGCLEDWARARGTASQARKYACGG